MTDNSKQLRLVDLDSQNFPGFKEMVMQQADHHLCDYVGNDEIFLNEVRDPSSPAHVMLAWSDEVNDSVGYVLYNKMATLKGPEIYIEDIITRDKYRGYGVGAYFFEQLKDLARKEQRTAVSWVVARNNVDAIRFYEERQSARPRAHIGYDCTNLLLKSEFNQSGQGMAAVSALTEEHLPQLVKANKISEKQALFLNRAIQESNIPTLIARDKSGEPAALLIANPNFSSFRTVYGYKVEMLELTEDAAQAITAFSALTDDLTERAISNTYQGHMIVFIDPDSDAQKSFIKTVDGEAFMMSDHPNSYLDLYAIDEDVIYPNGETPVNENKEGNAGGFSIFSVNREAFT